MPFLVHLDYSCVMPTLNAMTLPRPKHWQEFEDIVLASYKLAWASPSLQKNGRPGQKQAGVDIYGPDNIGRPTGIQCKRYDTLSLSVVKGEIANASAFKGQLSMLYIATTADHDAKLQQEVRMMSDARVAAGDFAVGLLFWEDVEAGLYLNTAILKTFYPQISIPQQTTADRSRLLAALELGFYGPFLWQYVLLTFGEIGEMAHTEGDTVEVVLRIVEERAGHLLAPTDAQPVLESIREIRRGAYEGPRDDAAWAQVEAHARRIANRISNVSSLLPMSEGGMLDVGIGLGRVEHDVDGVPSKSYVNNLKQSLRAILPPSSTTALDAKFRAAARKRWGYQWANVIRSWIDRELRYGSW